MQYLLANSSSKFLEFMDSAISFIVRENEEQQLTLRLENQEAGVAVTVTLIYAKYTLWGRLILWESLKEMAQRIQERRLIGMDFNFIINQEDK